MVRLGQTSVFKESWRTLTDSQCRYDKAALQGHAQAQNNLGVLHQSNKQKSEYPQSRFLASLGAVPGAEPRMQPGPRASAMCDEQSKFVGPRVAISSFSSNRTDPLSTVCAIEVARLPIEGRATQTEGSSTNDLVGGRPALQEAVDHSIIANQWQHERRRTDALISEAQSLLQEEILVQPRESYSNSDESERSKRIAEANRELQRWRSKVLDCEIISHELWRSIQDTEAMFEKAKEELQAQGASPKCKAYAACQPEMSYRKAGMAWTIGATNGRQSEKMRNTMGNDSSQVC